MCSFSLWIAVAHSAVVTVVDGAHLVDVAVVVAHLVDVVDVAIIFNVVSGDIIFDVVYGDNVVDVVYGGNIVDVVIAHTSLSRKILQDFTFHVKKGFAIRDLRGAVKVLFANFGTMKQKEKGIKKLITSFPNVAPFFSPKVMFMKCAGYPDYCDSHSLLCFRSQHSMNRVLI